MDKPSTPRKSNLRPRNTNFQAVKFPLLLLLIVVLIGCANNSDGRRTTTTTNNTSPTPIPTAEAAARPTYEVERGTVVYSADFPGRVSPIVEMELAFAIDGIVTAVHVERGQTVQVGDILAELDTQALEEALLGAQNELAIAQSRLDTATTESESNRRLAEIAVELVQLDLDYARQQAGDNPTTDQAYEISRLELALEAAQIELDRLNSTVDPVLQADVDEANLRVTQLQDTIAQATLTAPMTGQIISFNMAEGRPVTTGTQFGIIADTAGLEVSAGIPSRYQEDLAENLPVLIAPSGQPGNTVGGIITYMPFGNNEDQEIRITFDDPESVTFDLNDRVTVSARISEQENTLWLPPAAIRDFNGRQFVVVQDGEFRRRVDITTGLQNSEQVEVLSGVEEGDVIIGQ